MLSDNNVKIWQSENIYILYDVSLVENPQRQLFSSDALVDNKPLPDSVSAIGRAPVTFFQSGNLHLVLRHYYRGGLVAKLVHDSYFGQKPEKTRAFREWCLLRTMKNLNLPVPLPVAARVITKGFLYQADLVTLQIQNSWTLADFLLDGSASALLWQQIGRCIRKFHEHNIYHADLNARNILLQKNSSPDDPGIYLIDFDRGTIKKRGSSWQQLNLNRLKRSLNKFKQHNAEFHFNEANWESLLQGYNGLCE